MATPNQIKKRHKYADKNPQIKKGDIRLNLGENNHIDLRILIELTFPKFKLGNFLPLGFPNLTL